MQNEQISKLAQYRIDNLSDPSGAFVIQRGYMTQNEQITKYAHYYGTGKRKELIVGDTASPIGEVFQVSGLKDARDLAKKLNATPWNF